MSPSRPVSHATRIFIAGPEVLVGSALWRHCASAASTISSDARRTNSTCGTLALTAGFFAAARPTQPGPANPSRTPFRKVLLTGNVGPSSPRPGVGRSALLWLYREGRAHRAAPRYGEPR